VQASMVIIYYFFYDIVFAKISIEQALCANLQTFGQKIKKIQEC
jgi:hypothetical protein